MKKTKKTNTKYNKHISLFKFKLKKNTHFLKKKVNKISVFFIVLINLNFHKNLFCMH